MLVAMALAAAASGNSSSTLTSSSGTDASGSRAHNSAPSTRLDLPFSRLHMQAAKVISAQAMSCGDTLLSVPLNCSAGLHADAVHVLQDNGMWRCAEILAARALGGRELPHVLQRWALHVHSAEGCLWRAAGVLSAAGCCESALEMLQQQGLACEAAAFLQACDGASLLLEQAAGDSSPGEPQQQAQQRRRCMLYDTVRFASHEMPQSWPHTPGRPLSPSTAGAKAAVQGPDVVTSAAIAKDRSVCSLLESLAAARRS